MRAQREMQKLRERGSLPDLPDPQDVKDLPSLEAVQASLGILPSPNSSRQASPPSSSFVKVTPNAHALARDGFKEREINAGKTSGAVKGMINSVIEFRSLTGGALGGGKVIAEEEVTEKQLDLPPPPLPLPLTLPAAEKKDTRDGLPEFHYARTTRLGL
ncbi:hypothetical protein LCGC14_2708080 [marine sediment metagenome]|uniref:Uncharacterized protein n=1 Tax=marine sediment metagenome TaxID=412755 RepID=A0A0F8ZDR0_9ZZZZ